MHRLRFECNNRVRFAIEYEKSKQEAVRVQERQEMLARFQEERENLFASHTEALDDLHTNLSKQCETDTAKRVAEVETEANWRSLKLEIEWKLQETMLNVFIADAQKRLEEAVGYMNE